MTVREVVVLAEVAGDLDQGRAFYDQQEPDIGDYFWDSLVSDIESLKIYAGIHPRKHGVYRMLARRFPYAIYYELADDIAYVLAVLPMRRDPAWIRQQLRDRG